jgi:hypothetical protein
MPYKDPERRKQANNASYKRNAQAKQAHDLLTKLRKAYQSQETERRAGLDETPSSIPKRSTLAKYHIQVYAHPTKANVQIREPHFVDGHPTQSTPDSSEGALEPLWERLQANLSNDPEKFFHKQSTVNQYWKHFVQDVEIAGCDVKDVPACINDGSFITTINQHYQTHKTREAHFTSLKFVVNTADLFGDAISEEARKEIEDQLDWWVAQAQFERVQKVFDDGQAVEPFSAIFQRAMETVDEFSQISVLLHLYDDLTLRSDYNDVYVYDAKPSVEPTHNYYVRNEGVIYWKHIKKTGHLYGMDAFQYSAETRRVIEGSLNKEPRNKLIVQGTKYLLRQVGTGVNKLRHGKISEMYADTATTDEEKKRLAKEMHHSFATQQVYVRQLRGRWVQTTKNL